MLGEIETGHEPKFDFAAAGKPGRFYIIATLPRTGSTYLSHLLWATGCLGAPLEYLNFDPAGPWGHAAGDPAEQRRLWFEAVRSRTSPNGVFGVKCFPVQLQILAGANPPLLDEVMRALLSGRRAIYLLRRDRAAHTASFARAALSGVWREEQETGQTHAYSAQAMEEVAQGIGVMTNLWETMFRDLRIAPLRLWYEDVVASPAQAAAQVAEYLGVALDPAAAVAVPAVRKQSAPDIGDWARRYAQSKSTP